MKLAIMFSGGKDSVAAVHWAREQGHEISALIAVKPKNTEAYLYHYATVELTKFSAEALGIPLIYLETDAIGPEKEAAALEKIFHNLKVDAIVLGGVGLQKTQLKKIREVAEKYKIKVFASHENLTSEELLQKEFEMGLDIRITDVAAGGLGPEWIGKKLDAQSLQELLKLSKVHGFDALGEGGHYNTFVCDSPLFKKKVFLIEKEKIWDKKTSSGYLVADAKLVGKN